MKKDLKEQLVNRKIKKPSAVFMTMLMWLLGILNKVYKVQFYYDYDSKSLRGKPIILLSSHASRLEFIYTLYGFKRKDVNLVCGYQNILKKGLYGILKVVGKLNPLVSFGVYFTGSYSNHLGDNTAVGKEYNIRRNNAVVLCYELIFNGKIVILGNVNLKVCDAVAVHHHQD